MENKTTMATKIQGVVQAKEHYATAKLLSAPISTKQCVEISYYLRYENVDFAKAFLQDVIAMKKAVPYRWATKDLGHKAGMAAGRFPQKAAGFFLQLLNSVEANAQFKGLNTSNLKITKLIANKASIPSSGGRSRHATKRTHLEIEVAERKASKAAEGKEKKESKKESTGTNTKGTKKETMTKEKVTERSE